MNSFATTVVIFGYVFGGALLGMARRYRLPERHYSSDSREAVRLGMGLVATTVALVLGLLIASAKGFYDAQNTEMTAAAAHIVLLDRILLHYGPEATEARAVLRATVASLIDRSWQLNEQGKKHFDVSGANGEAIRDKIQELTPANDNQRSIRTQALGLAIQLGQVRWLMFAQKSVLKGRSFSCAVQVLYFVIPRGLHPARDPSLLLLVVRVHVIHRELLADAVDQRASDVVGAIG
jgi:hypothetical protein